MFINHANSSLYIGRNGTGMRQTDSMVGTIKYDRREKIFVSRAGNLILKEISSKQANKQVNHSNPCNSIDYADQVH